MFRSYNATPDRGIRNTPFGSTASSGGGGASSPSPPHNPNHHMMPSSSRPMGIFLVGATYLETVIYVPDFPQEDTKQRADWVEQRRGGNAANAAEVLSQDPRAKVWVMSAMPAVTASKFLLQSLLENNVKTDACVFHPSQISPPKAYIISSLSTGSKTVVSHSTLPDLTFTDFVKSFDKACLVEGLEGMDYVCPFYWLHFESRNTVEVCKMIDHVEQVYRRQGWRPKLTISVEFDKGDRPGIANLLQRADVCFFSQLYAVTLGFELPEDFLNSVAEFCKPTATIFCLWGTQGAVAHHIETKTDFSARASSSSTIIGPGGVAIPSHQNSKEIDVVGAGDAFVAGIILALGLRGYDIARGLKFACELARRKTLQYGFKRLVKAMPPDL